MVFKRFLLLFFSFFPLTLFAQEKGQERYLALVEKMYEAYELGDFPKAREYALSALRLSPSSPTSHLLWGALSDIHLSSKDTLAALSALSQAIALKGEEVRFRERRAELHALVGKPFDALLDYDFIVAQGGYRESILYNRALLRISVGQYVEAEKDLSLIISRNPKAYLPRIAVAQLEIGRGRDKDAERIYNYLVETYPEVPVAYRRRAELYLSQGRNALALRDLRHIIDHTSHATREDYLLRAKVWEAMGKKHEAAKDLREAKGMGSASPSAK